MIDRAIFFARVRAAFGPLSQPQVDGFTTILNVWQGRYAARTPLTQLAYVLATSWHETAAQMQPIKEYGNTDYFIRMYDVRGNRPGLARSMGNREPGDGPRYCGRGFVQLTWKVNYAKATDKLRDMGILSVFDSLVQTPDLAMRMDIAAAILFEGMEDGWFTGRTMDALIDAKVDGDEFADFVKARAVINGRDRDELIAGYARKFLAALTAAEKPAGGPAPSPAPSSPPPSSQSPPAPAAEPAQPIPVLPEPPPAAKPAPGWLATLASAFRVWLESRR